LTETGEESEEEKRKRKKTKPHVGFCFVGVGAGVVRDVFCVDCADASCFLVARRECVARIALCRSILGFGRSHHSGSDPAVCCARIVRENDEVNEVQMLKVRLNASMMR
jgi:hypothetical protein